MSWIKEIFIQWSCLSHPLKSTVNSWDSVCSWYAFWYGVLWIPILKTVDDNIIVSMCSLKSFVSKIRSYCRYGALRKTIYASGAPMVLTFFFDSNSFSICVYSVQQIFRSIFVGKFILSRSQKYLSGTLYTYFESIWTTDLFSLSSKLWFVLFFSALSLWLLLVPTSRIITDFFLYKISFSIIFRAFFGKWFSTASEYLQISWGSGCWDKRFICFVFCDVNFFYPMCKEIISW